MYYRRKILLSLIAAFNETGLEKIKLQKMLFLLCEQQKQRRQKPAFDFVPYKYGCYSFQAAQDLSVMETHYRLIRKDEDRLFISQACDHTLKGEEKQLADNLIEQFRHKTSADTVGYVYDRYPYYAVNSEWAMSAEQRKAADREKRAIGNRKEKRLFTIGYEGKSIDAYLNQLVKNNIALLCDVRKNPLSMKYGFSKGKLKAYCANLSIAYAHLPALGIESEKRQALNSPQDYKALFAGYKKTLPDRVDALSRIVELMRQHNRVALTCFEKEHEHCHRHCVSDYLQKHYGLSGWHL